MRLTRILVTVSALVLTLIPAQAAQAAAVDTVAVDFSTANGTPLHRASGTIYGFTEDGSLPQDHFYTDIGWHFERAGGAQLDNPGGWAAGKYDRRWASTLAQYKRTVALGGSFVILNHDLWGADGTTSPSFPGDNGNWTSYDAFLNRLISDVQANGMTPQWDIWNEPDGSNFWAPPQSQYLAMWARTYNRIRATFPNAVISGPSTAFPPSRNTAWWAAYLDYVKANNVVPDIISWHSLEGDLVLGDPYTMKSYVSSQLAARGITTTRPFQINEYAAPDQQTPGRSGWYISRLERGDMDGLRAHWGGGSNLHNDLANLLTRVGTQYVPRGDWFLYKFYGSMSGTRVAVSEGTAVDATASRTTGSAKILLGNRGVTGDVTVNLNGLSSTGLVTGGQVRAIVQQISNVDGAKGPSTVSDQTLTVTGNSASVNVPWTDSNTGYTVTLQAPGQAFQGVVVAQHSNMCLDDTNLSTNDGTQYQQYHCEGGNQQVFDFRPNANGTYTIVNQHSNKCLDVSAFSTADGAAVQQWSCHGGTNQQFTLRPVTGLDTTKDYQLVAAHSGKCVDVSEISTAPGAKIHQWTCSTTTPVPSKNQVWRLYGKA
jgi:hypothetical protein